MIVWVLMLTIVGGPTAALAVFPPTSEGRESCLSALKETEEALRQEVQLECSRYRLVAE